MQKKLKQKLHFRFWKGILAFSAVFLLGFLVFGSVSKEAEAATCKRFGDNFGTAGTACDGLTISMPAQVKVGDTVTVTMTITDAAQATKMGPLQKSYSLGICTSTEPAGIADCNIVERNRLAFRDLGKDSGVETTITLSVGQGLKNPGKYIIGGSVFDGWVKNGDGGQVGANVVTGFFNLEVLANTSGRASLVLNSLGQFINGPKLDKTFVWTFLDGGTSVRAAKVLYYCDFQGDETKGFVDSGTTERFICSYNSQAASYKLFIKALDSSGKTIPGATQTFQITVSGNEKDEGEKVYFASLSLSEIGSAVKSGIAALVNSVVTLLLGIIQEIIYFLFFYLIAPIIQAMLSIHVYTDAFVSVIYPGWEIVRNLTNIVFIVALIAIAMATLLRVESYQYKALLVQLILAALLVNFSLVIGQAILGVADTVQSQFLPNNVEVIRSLAKDLMVGWRNAGFTGFTEFSTVVKPFFEVSLALGSFCVFLALGAFLVIRMVMLWILLMLSPIAYAAGVLPATKQFRQQWWSNFIKYAFFTPIIAFFLNMAAIISNTLTKNLSLYREFGIDDKDFGNSDFAVFVFKVATNVLLLVFLLVAMKVAEQFGIYGAAGISNFVKGATFLPFKAAKAGAERAFEGVQNMTGITMDPRIWAAKWKEYSEREKHKRLEKRADTPIGVGKWRIKDSQKYGLGSPMDFYKNFVNVQAVKRMGKKLSKSSKDAFHEMSAAKKVLDDLKKEGSVMSEADFAKAEAGMAKADGDYGLKLAQVEQLMKDRKNLQDRLKQRQTDYKAPGISDTEKAKIKDELEEIRAEIAEKQAQLDKTGSLKVDEDGNIMRDSDGNLMVSDSNPDTSQLTKLRLSKEQLGQKVEDDKKKLDEAKKGNPGFQRFNSEEHVKEHNKKIGEALREFAEKQREFTAREIPKAYHARAARQSLEAEEEKKVSEIKNWPEKVQVFLSAQAENNPYLAAAVIKSLGKDSNFNEIVEALGYDSSAEGLKQFMEAEYRDRFGLTDHQMMEVGTEIAYVNEDSGWWNMARVSAIDDDGHLNWAIDTKADGDWAKIVAAKKGMTMEAMANMDHHSRAQLLMNEVPEGTEEYNAKWAPQNAEIKVEMEKRGPRLIANFARTSFVNQTAGPEGHVTTGIHKAGKELMASMSKTQSTRYEFIRMLRSNTAQAIAAAPEWNWEYCKKNNIDREIYEKISQMASSPIDEI